MTRQLAVLAWETAADVLYRTEAFVVAKALGMIAAGAFGLMYIAHRISNRKQGA